MPLANMCASFFIVGLLSMWGVLYAFWLSFQAFPVDSRVWVPTLDTLCALPRASLSVVGHGDSTFICLHTVGGVDSMALAANNTAFNECTLLDALVYLQGNEGGLCLAFQTKAEAEAFVGSIGFKDLAREGETELPSRASSPTLEDSFLSGLSASLHSDMAETVDEDDVVGLDWSIVDVE
ncbi:hypothetical protein LXA43DRAFT_1062508 [Ganoderma leucocontextum]|nr:hypothetical protein LXA43DRAFT_1062508 [Ganoderma leucocontextum]